MSQFLEKKYSAYIEQANALLLNEGSSSLPNESIAALHANIAAAQYELGLYRKCIKSCDASIQTSSLPSTNAQLRAIQLKGRALLASGKHTDALRVWRTALSSTGSIVPLEEPGEQKTRTTAATSPSSLSLALTLDVTLLSDIQHLIDTCEAQNAEITQPGKTEEHTLGQSLGLNDTQGSASASGGGFHVDSPIASAPRSISAPSESQIPPASLMLPGLFPDLETSASVVKVKADDNAAGVVGDSAFEDRKGSIHHTLTNPKDATASDVGPGKGSEPASAFAQGANSKNRQAVLSLQEPQNTASENQDQLDDQTPTTAASKDQLSPNNPRTTPGKSKKSGKRSNKKSQSNSKSNNMMLISTAVDAERSVVKPTPSSQNAESSLTEPESPGNTEKSSSVGTGTGMHSPTPVARTPPCTPSSSSDAATARVSNAPVSAVVAKSPTEVEAEVKRRKAQTGKILQALLAQHVGTSSPNKIQPMFLMAMRQNLPHLSESTLVNDLACLGYIHVNAGNHELAGKIFKLTLEYDKTSPSIYIGLGSIHAMQQRYDLAITEFSAAIELDGSIADAWKRRGQTKAAKGLVKSAAKDLTKAIALETRAFPRSSPSIASNPSSAAAGAQQGSNRTVAVKSVGNGNFEIDLDRLSGSGSGSGRKDGGEQLADTLNQRGLVYHQMKNYHRALIDFRAARDKGLDTAALLNYLGICEGQVGNCIASLRAHEAAVKKDRNFKEAHLNIALMHKECGNGREAEEAFQRTYIAALVNIIRGEESAVISRKLANSVCGGMDSGSDLCIDSGDQKKGKGISGNGGGEGGAPMNGMNIIKAANANRGSLGGGVAGERVSSSSGGGSIAVPLYAGNVARIFLSIHLHRSILHYSLGRPRASLVDAARAIEILGRQRQISMKEQPSLFHFSSAAATNGSHGSSNSNSGSGIVVNGANVTAAAQQLQKQQQQAMLLTKSGDAPRTSTQIAVKNETESLIACLRRCALCWQSLGHFHKAVDYFSRVLSADLDPTHFCWFEREICLVWWKYLDADLNSYNLDDKLDGRLKDGLCKRSPCDVYLHSMEVLDKAVGATIGAAMNSSSSSSSFPTSVSSSALLSLAPYVANKLPPPLSPLEELIPTTVTGDPSSCSSFHSAQSGAMRVNSTMNPKSGENSSKKMSFPPSLDAWTECYKVDFSLPKYPWKGLPPCVDLLALQQPPEAFIDVDSATNSNQFSDNLCEEGRERAEKRAKMRAILLFTKPLSEWIQLAPGHTPGFLPNKRQHVMFGIAVYQMAQALKKHMESIKIGGVGLEVADVASSTYVSSLSNSNTIYSPAISAWGSSSYPLSPSSYSRATGESVATNYTQNDTRSTVFTGNDGKNKKYSSSTDISLPNMDSFGPTPSSSGSTTTRGKGVATHTFNWRDLFDIIVRWRQVSEPNDPVFWIDRFPARSFSSGFGLHTPIVNGHLKTVRYFPYFAVAVDRMCHLMNTAGYYTAADVFVKPPSQSPSPCVRAAAPLEGEGSGILTLSVLKKLEEDFQPNGGPSRAQRLAALSAEPLKSLRELRAHAGHQDFYVTVPCYSCASPCPSGSERKLLEGTRLTLVAQDPEGFEFSIRTPGTPTRWLQFSTELEHCFLRLEETFISAASPSPSPSHADAPSHSGSVTGALPTSGPAFHTDAWNDTATTRTTTMNMTETTRKCSADENILRSALQMFYYWVTFAPISRGTASCGYAALLAVMLAHGKTVSKSLIPPRIQLDWEAILAIDAHEFIEKALQWLLPTVADYVGDGADNLSKSTGTDVAQTANLYMNGGVLGAGTGVGADIEIRKIGGGGGGGGGESIHAVANSETVFDKSHQALLKEAQGRQTEREREKQKQKQWGQREPIVISECIRSMRDMFEILLLGTEC